MPGCSLPLLAQDIENVAALVLTHRRPRLAGDVVRALIEVEGFPARSVYLIVNGEGGIDDKALEERVNVLRLPRNMGPAGGYGQGLRHVHAESDAHWIYLCEDDVGLFDIPSPRVGRLIREVDRTDTDRVGAVVAYGRRLRPRTGFAPVHQVAASASGLEPVDLAPWGATLLSRSVLDDGIFPDPAWFFGFEDFDYWLQVRQAGYALLLDVEAARAVTDRASGVGRDASFAGQRPNDSEEAWRAYYLSRNFLELRRRWGRPTWTGWHLLKSLRRLQLAPSRQHRVAVLEGLRDGFLGRLGKHQGYQRKQGEL